MLRISSTTRLHTPPSDLYLLPGWTGEILPGSRVPVATRTTAPPKLDDKQMAVFLEKAKALAPKYHTELLKEA